MKFWRRNKPVALNPHTGRPIGCPPTSREEIAALIKSIDDRHVKHHVDKALAPLHSAALAFLNEYEKYQEDDSVAFAPNREVLEAFRKAVKG